MKSWYAVHTQLHAEQRVARTLAERDIATFVPQVRTQTTKQQVQRKPFFPGYIFAELDLQFGNPVEWKYTPGLRRLVGYGDRPVPIPAEVIGFLRSRLAELDANPVPLECPFELGDIVRVKSGPFEGMLGIFEGPITPAERVQILLTAIHRSFRLRMHIDQLEKAPPDATVDGTPRGQMGRRRRGTRGRGRQIHYKD